MVQEPEWLIRQLECFDKRTEELVYVKNLPKSDLRLFQIQWDQPENEPMIACFEVTNKQVQFLKSLDPILELNFQEYDYFIGAVTNNWEQTVKDGGFMGLFPPPIDL
ncbi:hypothetical protein CH352_18765 [Leptospira hartskeerlii]|uniref:DUF7683 domain-containing protein n=1 Tax=Leptospira hartskeerlii TaxID=2023177 RepID=A0A2M9X865_9LEPT|nr:hypothetical protein [Leptospira hartskeerlii]PJZ23890.1 hypothetical protein CH357_18820 [Leptospira hartskeerlii]PJZ31928.1 hypothetical protein CH352_18765 [Leptospira hartskeerlii]